MYFRLTLSMQIAVTTVKVSYLRSEMCWSFYLTQINTTVCFSNVARLSLELLMPSVITCLSTSITPVHQIKHLPRDNPRRVQ